jgi:CubicO group peptidase (beta-lactamase class C family)
MNLPASFRGCVQVVRAGHVVFETTRDPAAPRCLATRFPVASVSKHFVAAAALLLHEDGLLPFDAGIVRWFADAPPAWQSITVHHLLTHTSGMGHWRDIAGFDITRPPARDELARQLMAAPLIASPGERGSYSGPGFFFAGLIVEAVAGMPYGEFVEQRIFRCLAMDSTTSGVRPAGTDVAEGFHGGSPAPAVDGLAAIPGTGDAWSTVGDLNRYTTALAAGALLREDSLARMSTAWTAVDGASYGYGTFLGPLAGRPARWHPGDNPGFRSLRAEFTDDGTAAAVLCNDDAIDPLAVLDQLS